MSDETLSGGYGSGRPKDLVKRQSIIAAARVLFFAEGFEDVAIEHIAAKAGVSKVTIYGHFGTKNAIFETVVAGELERVSSALDALPSTAKILRDRLIDFGTELMVYLTSPELMSLERLLMAQAERQPDMARALLDAGPRHCHRKLAAHLAHANEEAGHLIPDLEKAAMQLVSLWQDLRVYEQRFGMQPQPSRDEICKHVTEGVDLLLRGYSLNL
jgi:TetR/AcrR family transcriptional regulator, mexJK operon transcriptional repressor